MAWALETNWKPTRLMEVAASAGGVAPFQGAEKPSYANPGCAARPWALELNRFAVVVMPEDLDGFGVEPLRG